MNVHLEYEPSTTDRLPGGLPFAIEETTLVRSLIKSKGLAEDLKAEKPDSQRLLYLNRDIEYFESKLAQVRSWANIEKHLNCLGLPRI